MTFTTSHFQEPAPKQSASKRLTFTELTPGPRTHSTKRFEVTTTGAQPTRIGTVQWAGKAYSYTFMPINSPYLDSITLKELTAFLESETKAHVASCQPPK